MIWSCAFFINAIYWVETFPLYSYFLSVCYEYLLYFVKYFFCISWDDHMLLILMLWCMCLNLRNPMDCSLSGLTDHGILQVRILECSCSLFQEIFTTQGSNPGLPHCRWSLYHVSHQGSPWLTDFEMLNKSCISVTNLTLSWRITLLKYWWCHLLASYWRFFHLCS